MIFRVQQMGADTCSNTWEEGEPLYVEADDVRKVERRFPRDGFTFFVVKHIGVCPIDMTLELPKALQKQEPMVKTRGPKLDPWYFYPMGDTQFDEDSFELVDGSIF